MGLTTIRAVQTSQRSRAINALVLAFATDPVIRWLWTEPDAYVRHFPVLLGAFGGRAFDHRAAHVSERFRGVALWLRPEVSPDDAALEALTQERVRAEIRPELREIFERMDRSVPSVPHWHLAFLGVDPAWQGHGIGAALLRHALREIDIAGATSYLESTNPRNLSLYRRHGFEVTHEIRVGDAPPLFPMVRRPR